MKKYNIRYLRMVANILEIQYNVNDTKNQLYNKLINNKFISKSLSKNITDYIGTTNTALGGLQTEVNDLFKVLNSEIEQVRGKSDENTRTNQFKIEELEQKIIDNTSEITALRAENGRIAAENLEQITSLNQKEEIATENVKQINDLIVENDRITAEFSEKITVLTEQNAKLTENINVLTSEMNRDNTSKDSTIDRLETCILDLKNALREIDNLL